MENFFLTSVFWILAIYGALEIIKNIVYIFTFTRVRTEGINVIITVKNEEDTIEAFLRTLIFRILYGKEDNIKNLIVVDLNSEDNTLQILKKLEKDNNIIKLVSWRECKELINDIDKL